MFKMSIGQYLPGNSPVHRMDPRVKLVVTFLLIIGVFFIHSLWGYLAVALYLTAVIAISKIPVAFLLKACLLYTSFPSGRGPGDQPDQRRHAHSPQWLPSPQASSRVIAGGNKKWPDILSLFAVCAAGKG